MVKQMDDEGFGNCTVTGSCEAVAQGNLTGFYRTYEPRIRPRVDQEGEV